MNPHSILFWSTSTVGLGNSRIIESACTCKDVNAAGEIKFWRSAELLGDGYQCTVFSGRSCKSSDQSIEVVDETAFGFIGQSVRCCCS